MTGYSLKEISEQLNTGEIPNIANYGNTYTKDEVYTKTEVLGSFGNLSSPLLDLPLKNSLAMKAGVGDVTFTRASTATYIDRYGVLKYSAIDEPRFEKDGLLVEGASTNTLLNSADFSSWGQTNGTLNSGTTPDGIANNCYYIADTTTNEHKVYGGFGGVNYTANSSIAASLFVKHNPLAVHKELRVRFYDNSGFAGDTVFSLVDFSHVAGYNLQVTATELANEWFRVVVTYTNTNDRTNLRFSFMEYSNGSISVAGDGINGNWYAFPQLEALPFATSYIPTTNSAVTRGDEICYATLFQNTPGDNIRTISVKSKLLGINQAGDNYIYSQVGLSNVMCIVRTTGNIDLYGTVRTQTIGYDPTEKLTIVQSSTDTSIKAFIDGVNTATAINSVLPSNAGSGQIVFGRNKLAVTNHKSYMHITDFKIYDKALTPTEVALA